jgi:hypothetical protein
MIFGSSFKIGISRLRRSATYPTVPFAVENTNPEAAYKVTLYLPFHFQFIFLISKYSSRQVCPHTVTIFPLPLQWDANKNQPIKMFFFCLFSFRIRHLNDITSLNILFPASPLYSQHLSSFKYKIPGYLRSLFCPRGFPSLLTHMNLSIYGSTVLSLDLGRFFNFLILYSRQQLLGRGISPSQGRYLHKEQHKQRINAHRHQCLE